MIRATMVALLALATGCEQDEEAPLDPDVTFGVPQGTQIPYRNGGAFVVHVRIDGRGLTTSTHATVEIDSDDVVPGAVAAASMTLTEQADGAFAGAAALAWPLGGKRDVKLSLPGFERTYEAPLEPLTLEVHPGTISSNGSTTIVPICVDSSSSDGTLTVRLDHGVIKDTRNADATLPLNLGKCDGSASDPSNPSTFVKFKVAADGPNLGVVVNLGSAPAIPISIPVTDAGAVAFTISSPTVSPPPFSIAQVDVHATRGGVNAKGVEVTFTSTPNVNFLPATATTDESGVATTRFPMPELGDVYVEAHVGNEVEGLLVQ